MIKYFTKKELMYLWIEKNIGKFLAGSLTEVLQDEIPGMPDDLKSDIENDFYDLANNSPVAFSVNAKDISDVQVNSDCDDIVFKNIEKAFYVMKKTWAENEEKYIEELKNNYSEKDIVIILKDE
jgi:hypothetical protein